MNSEKDVKPKPGVVNKAEVLSQEDSADEMVKYFLGSPTQTRNNV